MNFYPVNYEVNFLDIEKYQYPNRKVGVIAHIENTQGEILLQQRGTKSRDEQGLYEDVGGKVDLSDKSFKEAIIREIQEEAGNDIELEFSNSIGICHIYKNDINWLFIIYFVKYLKGTFQIMEPTKCLGYKFFTYNDLIASNLVSESCKFISKSIKNLQS